MAQTVKLAEYLFTRLRQLGIESIHGVPGDYNLELLDHVQRAGLRWVGNANELNAGYAADGYARIKGIGALVTTFGVGELSAANAIAGAYAERAPVVHIVGSPSRTARAARSQIHHTFSDGEYGRFAQMSMQITVAQAILNDLTTSPNLIDAALVQCLMQSRPVYISVPVDLVAAPVSAAHLTSPIKVPLSVPNETWHRALDKLRARIGTSKSPIILVDGGTRALGIIEDVASLIKASKWHTWTTTFGKGLVDEPQDNVFGIFRGSFADESVKTAFDESDLILCFGPQFTLTNSYDGTSIPRPEAAILFTREYIKFGNETFWDVSSRWIVQQLLGTANFSELAKPSLRDDFPRDTVIPWSAMPSAMLLNQQDMWRVMAQFLRPGDIVLGETGTAGHGVRQMPLPEHCRTFLPATWLSIGYMLPASHGAALAQRELIASSRYYGLSEARTVLFIGDGSFQMTAQELSTIIRERLDVIIFLINNSGYTIERAIHGLRQSYNDVAQWRYLEAPSFFGANESTFTASARTFSELRQALEHAEMVNGRGLRMVELMLDREDVPEGPLRSLMDQRLRESH